MTAHLQVLTPRYLPIIVQGDVRVWPQAADAGADLGQVQIGIVDRVMAFLHPTHGGPAGTGWLPGQVVYTSDLLTAIAPPRDVGYVSSLLIKPGTPVYPSNNGVFTAADRPRGLTGFGTSVVVEDYELICAAARGLHTIQVTRDVG